MNVFATFLRSTNQGTYDRDKIYVGDISSGLIDGYITWRRDIRQNGDETINHSLTPILKACSYAADMGMIEPAINARIQDMMIVTKPTLSDEESEFDGKTLTKEQMEALLEYYKNCKELRHIGNIYTADELEEGATCAKIAQVRQEEASASQSGRNRSGGGQTSSLSTIPS